MSCQAVALGDLDHIDVGDIHAGDIAAYASEIAEPFQGGIVGVANNDKDYRDIVLGGGPEGLDGILDGAVADGANDTPMRIRHLKTHGCRNAETEDAGAYGIKGAGLVEANVAVKVALGGGALLANDRVWRDDFIENAEEVGQERWGARV